MTYLEVFDLIKEEFNKPSECFSVFVFLNEYKEKVSFEFLRKQVNLRKKNLELILKFLIDNKIVKNDGDFYIINNKDIVLKPSKKNVVNNENKDMLVVLEHLNSISGKKFRLNSSTIKQMKRIFKEGYSVDDFIIVNKYYSMLWNTPDMNKYIQPSTLYNTKFPNRVDESLSFFESIKDIHLDILDVIDHYKNQYFKYFNTEYIYTFDDFQSILFWIKNGENKEDMKIVLSSIFSEWHKDSRFSQYLLPYIIFSSKYPSRKQKYLVSKGNIKYKFLDEIHLKGIHLNSNSISEIELYIDSNSIFLIDIEYIFNELEPNIYFSKKILHEKLIYRIKTQIIKYLSSMYSTYTRNIKEENYIIEMFVDYIGGWNKINELSQSIVFNLVDRFLGEKVRFS